MTLNSCANSSRLVFSQDRHRRGDPWSLEVACFITTGRHPHSSHGSKFPKRGSLEPASPVTSVGEEHRAGRSLIFYRCGNPCTSGGRIAIKNAETASVRSRSRLAWHRRCRNKGFSKHAHRRASADLSPSGNARHFEHKEIKARCNRDAVESLSSSSRNRIPIFARIGNVNQTRTRLRRNRRGFERACSEVAQSDGRRARGVRQAG